MKNFILLMSASFALMACQAVETGPDVKGKPMLYETPRTVMRAPGLFAVMVRGNVYRIEPLGDQKGWRVTAGVGPTFKNVAVPDERGATDAVVHLAKEIRVKCQAPEKLTVVRRPNAANQSGIAENEQFWTMSPDCG